MFYTQLELKTYCGQRKLEYCRAQITEMKYICQMPLRRLTRFWIKTIYHTES